MYSRSFRPSQKRTEGDIPVQYFGDSFSADAFKNNRERKSYDIEKKREEEKFDRDLSESKNDDKTIAPTNTARKYDIEDLVLIGLVLLFATDIKEKDDIIIPVILAAILLF